MGDEKSAFRQRRICTNSISDHEIYLQEREDENPIAYQGNYAAVVSEEERKKVE